MFLWKGKRKERRSRSFKKDRRKEGGKGGREINYLLRKKQFKGVLGSHFLYSVSTVLPFPF